MPLYVIRLTHPPDQCPTSNSKIREMLAKGVPALPQLADKLGVKFLAGPLIIGDEHEGVAVVEAERIETVGDFVRRSGLVQWNAVRVSMAQPLQQALNEMDKVPPPLY